MLSHVTFTGWDDQTDLIELACFCRDQQPGTVEIAVLMSYSRMGADRYPSTDYAESILLIAKAHGQRAAAHVCGQIANRMLLAGRPDAGPASRVVSLADRVQVNVSDAVWPTHDASRYGSAERLADGISRPVIVQVRDPEKWPPKLGRVQFLFDRSGGRGEVAKQVPPLTDFAVGYAGGLGPENVHAFLDGLRPMRQQVPVGDVRFTAPIWIDMESGIRESMASHPGGPQPTLNTRDEPATQPPTYVSVNKCAQVMDAVRWALMPA